MKIDTFYNVHNATTRGFARFFAFVLIFFFALPVFAETDFDITDNSANFDGHQVPSYNMTDGLGYGLNYGARWLNSAGEAAFIGLTDKGRARFNFTVDVDGRVNGEGDILYPFYDGQYTTVFTQAGLRTMSGMSNNHDDGRGADRWIGNFGLGQRWYPEATVGKDGKTIDSGNWMVGYNAFFDYDFSRAHRRGGVGVEAQWDWLKVATNYYFPLSSWKGSYDFDSRLVEERPAQGWDVRVKGYLPFYRNLAVTAAYTQWRGEHVGMFSSADLEKNPKVWSYGLEYTPIPLISGFWNQRSTERGRSDTEFGLHLTYHFGMSLEDQTSPVKVAQLRGVNGSRHEFVDRENRIILEYRDKSRASDYSIILAAGTLNPPVDGSSVMTVKVMNSGSALSGENVDFTWTVKGSSLSPKTGGTSTTNASGEAIWTLTGSGDRRTITVTATLRSDPSKTATADVTFGDALPNGFIALASDTMTWDSGVSYCADQGGSLPALGTYPGETLPKGFYWSSDESDSDVFLLYIEGSNLSNSASPVDKSFPSRVICVP